MSHFTLATRAALMGLCLVAASCAGDKKDEAPKGQNPEKAKAVAEGNVPTINIRYIDGDSISEHYNLAKDYKDFYQRTLTTLSQAERSKAAEIQKFANQIDEKLKSNGYLSEASYNGDKQKLNKMQQDAQNYMAQLQRKADQQNAEYLQQLNDSIENYIKVYNKDKGYDAILYRTAGVYYTPALDITDEVIAGLNERYKKPSKDDKK